jgi:pimeloyl-ACP methyl ester carboxylesterase
MADTSSHLRPPPLDPRTASTQSLAPSYNEDGQDRKQRLLLVYIHGFVGSEASFHSFPFHVHMKLKERLAATHAIHSKIYPRYKTYKAFHLATENLSHWLSAHEDSNTDVILVGHSMGGLLAEEVVLLVCRDC